MATPPPLSSVEEALSQAQPLRPLETEADLSLARPPLLSSAVEPRSLPLLHPASSAEEDLSLRLRRPVLSAEGDLPLLPPRRALSAVDRALLAPHLVSRLGLM